MRTARLDEANDGRLVSNLLDVDVQPDTAVDELHRLIDLQELGPELLLQRGECKLAHRATGWCAFVVVVDVDIVRTPADVDLDMLDAQGDGAAVAFGSRQAGNAAFATVSIDQSWHVACHAQLDASTLSADARPAPGGRDHRRHGRDRLRDGVLARPARRAT